MSLLTKIFSAFAPLTLIRTPAGAMCVDCAVELYQVAQLGRRVKLDENGHAVGLEVWHV